MRKSATILRDEEEFYDFYLELNERICEFKSWKQLKEFADSFEPVPCSEDVLFFGVWDDTDFGLAEWWDTHFVNLARSEENPALLELRASVMSWPNLIGDVVSPRLRRLARVNDLSSMEKIRIIQKLRMKEGDILWISDKDVVWLTPAGKGKSQTMKLGKAIKLVNPTLSEQEVSNIIEDLRWQRVDIKPMLTLERADDVYNSDQLKIGSCMVGKDLSLYDQLEVQALVYRNPKSGNILARCLIHQGKYWSRIYTTNDALYDKFSEYINGQYSAIPTKFKTPWVKGDPKEFFIPYMDVAPYCYSRGGKFCFSDTAPVNHLEDDGLAGAQYIGVAYRTNGELTQ